MIAIDIDNIVIAILLIAAFLFGSQGITDDHEMPPLEYVGETASLGVRTVYIYIYIYIYILYALYLFKLN